MYIHVNIYLFSRIGFNGAYIACAGSLGVSRASRVCGGLLIS